MTTQLSSLQNLSTASSSRTIWSGTGRRPFDRKLFTQRDVLETLRLYIDVNDRLVTEIHSVGLLSDDERHLIASLEWPTNRSELLQVLIKKKWTSAMFELFCDALKRNSTSTGILESNGVLADKLRQAAAMKAENIRQETSINGTKSNGGQLAALPNISSLSSSSSSCENSQGHRSGSSSTVESLESLLQPLPKSSRCTVRVMIRDRDDRVARLTSDLDLWRNEARRFRIADQHAEQSTLSDELEDAQMRIHSRDQTFSDWLAALPMVWVSSPNVSSSSSKFQSSSTAIGSTAECESFVDSLETIRNTLFSQSDLIAHLEAEKNQLMSDLRRRNGDRDQLELAKIESDRIRLEKENLVKRLAETERRLASFLDASQAVSDAIGENDKDGKDNVQKSKETASNVRSSSTNTKQQATESRLAADNHTTVNGKGSSQTAAANRNRKMSAFVPSFTGREALTKARRVSDTSVPPVGRPRRVSAIDGPSTPAAGATGNSERRSGTSLAARTNVVSTGGSRVSWTGVGTSTARQDDANSTDHHPAPVSSNSSR